MRNRSSWLVAALLAAFAVRGNAQPPQDSSAFPAGIILIGAQTHQAPEMSAIDAMSSEGTGIQRIFHVEAGSLFMGRLSRRGDLLAVCHVKSGEQSEFLLVKPNGEATKVMDGQGTITAWSPDGHQLAYFRTASKGSSWESGTVDLTTGRQTPVALPADYLAEDWHPLKNIRTLIYMNPRNVLYRERKGDGYPTRQLDLLTPEGEQLPITKNPCSDNIWSRFSPDGKQLAHYGRRLVGEKSLECAVVCREDGSQPQEIFNFTEYGDKQGLPWFRPNGPAAWSPDGSTLAWLVSTNVEPHSEGERLEIIFVSVDGRQSRRLSLTDLGFQRVSALCWR